MNPHQQGGCRLQVKLWSYYKECEVLQPHPWFIRAEMTFVLDFVIIIEQYKYL